jgi:DNA-3-methyladenine glycosylase
MTHKESQIIYKPLDHAYFGRSTIEVARDMIGDFLIHKTFEGVLVGRIVETEAYCEYDEACHAYRNCLLRDQGKTVTGRSALLFGEPGFSYVYLNYGMYWLFNVVTEPLGTAGAVLVRALEPACGEELMAENRGKIKARSHLTNGPGKLTLAMGIDGRHNGLDMTTADVFVAQGAIKPGRRKLGISKRIGISQGVDKPWRFFEKDNPFISPHRNL